MDRYIIISEHTAEDCRMVVKEFVHYHAGFLTNFEWGCYDNDHHAYTILEAENHAQALMAVPPALRNKARAIKLTHFKPREGKDTAHQSA
ncbi:MAG: hypothetical protein NTV09_05430 [Bacteroidetes bacterium]|nr:hypothetical protein [Bacteroidota bacterium]